MAVTLSKYGSSINRLLCHLVGLSTDTKPIGTYTDKSGKVFLLENGSSYEEMDTDKKYLYDAENQQWNLASSGGGGGGSATLIEKSITENGEYNASDDSADGYSKVTVDVAGGGGGETFEVEIICSNQNVSSPKTYQEIKSAYDAGGKIQGTINFFSQATVNIISWIEVNAKNNDKGIMLIGEPYILDYDVFAPITIIFLPTDEAYVGVGEGDTLPVIHNT